MGNQNKPEIQEIETTINYVSDKGNYYQIFTSPVRQYLRLYKDHPQFIEFYNKLRKDSTHRISYIYEAYNCGARIINIEGCAKYTVYGILEGFLDMQVENRLLGCYGYYQLVFSNLPKNEAKILVKKDVMKGMTIGNSYSVTYVKDIGDNYYTIVNLQSEE